jgi:hypothetical protein
MTLGADRRHRSNNWPLEAAGRTNPNETKQNRQGAKNAKADQAETQKSRALYSS